MIIACPNCSNRFQIASEYIGREFQCPVCGKDFIAQADNQAQADPAQNDNSQNGSAPLKNDSGFTPLENDSGFTPLEKDSGFTPLENNSSSFGQMGNESNGSPAHFQMAPDDNAMIAYRRLLGKKLSRAERLYAGVKNNPALELAVLFSPLIMLLWPLIIIGYILKAIFGDKTSQLIAAFQHIRWQDDFYLNRLDMLSYVGKKESSLVAKPQTFFSPAVKSSECRFAFAGDFFIYSVAQITKIYILPEQLVMVHALWDYTKGILFDEGSEAFFFKDITNISTEYGYEDRKKKIFNKLLLFIAIIIVIISVLLLVSNSDAMIILGWIGIAFGIFLGAMVLASAVTIMQKFRKSETLIITNSSGRSMEISLLCNEWIQAKQGRFEQRTSNEKLFHAIRKMIEEKKIEATNG